MPSDLPLIDLGPLRGPSQAGPGPDRGRDRAAAAARVAHEIDRACRRFGFFRVTGHGIAPERRDELERLARAFFAQPDRVKARIAMARGGAAWRGWFPLGGELTAGRPDHKEGVYFGAELGPDHPAVVEGRPLHGPNLFPDEPAALRPAVLGWMAAMADIGDMLLRLMATGLGLGADWFESTVAAEPTVLFRIFRYPPTGDHGWGVAEHTDYGLLTILAQDRRGGLEVRGPDGWIAVPPDPDVLVVNLGDMLDRMTEGRYRSTPHRVRNTSGAERLSFPCFVDPSWDAFCTPMPLAGTPPADDPARRWDGASVRAWDGTYGDYLTAKVARVFPQLSRHLT
ncbi:MAG TPA: 2-oxoglutarate and iron-dependent oxygenase domain-containing protein [Acidimicrobiales bacterium]